ncbi:hypothetical protein NE865_05099 [Phthorimaea operculella]|nr:hypothetical protein NE865_05099 [Phthorimaea operculella]
MGTNDKHCQTLKNELSRPREDRVFLVSDANAMLYDETVEVNAQEIESPEESGDEEVVKAAMAKFNPPVRHTARHDFDSDTETESELENFMDNASGEDVSPDRKSDKPFELSTKPELPKQNSKDSAYKEERGRDRLEEKGRDRLEEKQSREERQMEKLERRAKSAKKRAELGSSESEETDSAEIEEAEHPTPAVGSGRKKTAGVVIPAEGAYDPKNFQDLKVPADIENLFQYIMKYTPQKIDIDFKLQPFVPEYVPAVGDIDAFIKVTTPACNVRGQAIGENVLEHIDNLGLTVLDEPAAEQSDSALLHLQLRAISKTSSAKSTVLTKKIENAEKNTKAIDRWIKDVSELHLSKPAPTVTYSSKMPDIDTLMEEWPENIEETLNDVGFPPPTLDCTLSQYVDIVCGLFDIPIAGDTLNDRIQALHLLFSLYSAVKNNQLFEERQEKVENNV